MKKVLVGLAVVGILGLGFMAKAASLTAISEASFNNIEKLAPVLQANFTNLNNEVVAATTKTASGVTTSKTVVTNITFQTCLATNSAGAEVAVVTNVIPQTTVLKFANGICTNAP